MVNESRYLNGRETDTPAYRRIGQAILDRATVMNSGVKITDSQSGFRAFSASTKDIFRFNAHGMAIESEMLADAGRAGLRVKEVPIGVRYDVDGSTENPVRHRVTVLLMIFKDMEYSKPLYYFTFRFPSRGGRVLWAHFLKEFLPGWESGIRGLPCS